MDTQEQVEKSRKVKISPTMKDCLEYASRHDCILRRYQGGFWAKAGWKGPRLDGVWFGTTTVEALVDRGLAEYTQWQEGRVRFPVEARTNRVELQQ